MPQMAPFPSVEADYRNYVENAVTLLLANATRLKVDAAKQTALSAARADFLAAYDKTSDRATRRLIDTAEKNRTKKILTDLLRATYKEIPASVLTNGDRNTLGLKLRDHRTRPNVPTSYPRILSIDANHRLRHRIKYFDDETRRRAKPKNILGSEVWCAQGTVAAPPDLKDYHYLGLSITSPYLAQFEGADGGKVMYYLLRWINTRGERGPWSSVAAAPVLM